MKCERHPEMDAVGTCVYCGRGICDQCKVRVNELLHCKECATAGRVLGGAPPPQARPPMMMYQMIPAAPVMNEPYIPPEPAGPPNEQLFTAGLLGAILTLCLSIVCAIAVPLVFIYRDLYAYASMIFSFTMLPLAAGYIGFHRNYGIAAAGNVAMLLVALFLSNAILWAYVIVVGAANACYFGAMISSIMLGIALLAMAGPLTNVSYRMRPGRVSRKDLQTAKEALFFAGILFVTVIGPMIIGWVVLAYALINLTGGFMHAPMPGSEPAGEPEYNPTVAQSVPVTYVEEETSRTANTIVERVDDQGRIF